MANELPDDRSEVNERLTAIEQKLQQVPTREELRQEFVTKAEFYSEVGDVRAQMTGLRTDVGDLRTEVGGLRIEVGDLRTEVGVLRTDVGVLRTEVGDLRTEVGGLRTEVGGQRVELGGLRTQMEQFNRDTRRHFEVIAESLRDDIKLLAEGQAAIIARLDASLADRDADRSTLEFHDLRLTRLETHQGLEPPSRPVRRP